MYPVLSLCFCGFLPFSSFYEVLTSIPLISFLGEVIWIREEALEGIVAVEMVDLPSSQATSESVLSLLQVEGNPFVQFLQRINLQAREDVVLWCPSLSFKLFSSFLSFLQAVLLRDWVKRVAEKGTASLFQVTDSGDYLRDEFNMKKMIVAATASGKVREEELAQGLVEG